MAQQPPLYAQQRQQPQQQPPQAAGSQAPGQVTGQQAGQPVAAQQPPSSSVQPGEQTAAQAPRQWLEQNLTSEQREVIEECREIVEICEWVVDQTIHQAPERTDLIRICRDCADLAALNVRFASRNSQFSSRLTELVREACTACANVCEQYGEEYNMEAASHCRRCADSCMRLLQTLQA